MLKLLLLVSLCATSSWAQQSPVWTWQCQEGRCVKQLLEATDTYQSVAACKLVCDTYSTLWPRPTGRVELERVLVPIDYDNINITVVSGEGRALSGAVEKNFNAAAEIFLYQLTTMIKKREQGTSGGKLLQVQVTIDDSHTHSLQIGSNESYELYISERQPAQIDAVIIAPEFFGARHALETLNQLITYDDATDSLVIMRNANITDSPAFPFRSLSLDTSRNYFSVESIKRTIDGMAASKLNTFHWHITDTHSFPFQSETYPKLSQYGAYTPNQIYTPEDIKSVVEYARSRGVRVIPELDAPAHVGEGWQWAGPNVTVCVNAQPWNEYCVEPPCGQLNPTNDNVYEILGGIYRDMLALFEPDIFHMGGDEVSFECWRSSPEIVNWMTEQGMGQNDSDYLQLWDMFQERAYVKVVEANLDKEIPVVLWTSHLTEQGSVNKYLDTDKYIIQIWSNSSDQDIAELVNKGFRVIFSNYDALYFDCGFGGWVDERNNWCSPYIGWQKVYMNQPYTLLTALGVDVSLGTKARELVLGGEAVLWTEEVDENTLDGRYWPRAAALAERLWSDPDKGWQEAEYRMLAHRERLVQRGIQSEALQPQWCYQNEGSCPLQGPAK